MKQAQNARKQRGRSPSRKGGGKPGGQGNARNEPKVRGNPKQLLEKYKNQAREAKQAGDRVLAEYYYQFADHYQRVLNEMRGPNTTTYVEGDDDDYEIDGNREGNQEARGEGRGNDNRGEGRDSRGEGRGENRRGRNRGGRQGGRDNDEASADSSGAPDADGDNSTEERPARRGRGRNPRRGAEGAVDPAKTEQPVEVHPELDLDGSVAAPADGSDEEKPKRRRATSTTPRKRTPRAKKDVDGAEAPDAPSPEDNAAA